VAVGGGADVRVVQPLSAVVEGLRAQPQEQRGVGDHQRHSSDVAVDAAGTKPRPTPAPTTTTSTIPLIPRRPLRCRKPEPREFSFQGIRGSGLPCDGRNSRISDPSNGVVLTALESARVRRVFLSDTEKDSKFPPVNSHIDQSQRAKYLESPGQIDVAGEILFLLLSACQFEACSSRVDTSVNTLSAHGSFHSRTNADRRTPTRS
jgi:hypothetical protein